MSKKERAKLQKMKAPKNKLPHFISIFFKMMSYGRGHPKLQVREGDPLGKLMLC